MGVSTKFSIFVETKIYDMTAIIIFACLAINTALLSFRLTSKLGAQTISKEDTTVIAIGITAAAVLFILAQHNLI